MANLVEDPDGTLHALVDHLGYDLEPSILIGGWATWLRVGGEISHDIDLIIGNDSVRAKLEARLDELGQSNHLQGRKLNGSVDGVHLDIYVPYQSQLGDRLRLRVEKLAEFSEPAPDPAQRWLLLTIEAHVVTKFAALLDRAASLKGIKDANEIFRLLRRGVDPRGATTVLADATAGAIEDIPEHVERVFRLVAERADTNREDRKWLDRLRRDWADQAIQLVRQRTQPPRLPPAL